MKPLSRYQYRFKAMGGPCSIQLYAESENEAALHAKCVMGEVYRLEAKYSRYRDDSILSKINSASLKGEGITVDDETAGILNYAGTVWHESNGLFDVTSGVLRKAWDFKSGCLPGQKSIETILPLVGWDKLNRNNSLLSFSIPGIELDFGGIVKEYAADRASAICAQRGVQHGMVELGGDIRVVGAHPNEAPWMVGIRNPRIPEQAIAMVPLQQGGLASSGDYERYMIVNGVRYSHLLNPKTGWPAKSLASVTVVADQCLIAGSATTVAMLKGEEGLEWLESLGLPFLAIDQNGVHHGRISNS
jgi:FAD:protein FMN transferase